MALLLGSMVDGVPQCNHLTGGNSFIIRSDNLVVLHWPYGVVK